MPSNSSKGEYAPNLFTRQLKPTEEAASIFSPIRVRIRDCDRLGKKKREFMLPCIVLLEPPKCRNSQPDRPKLNIQ